MTGPDRDQERRASPKRGGGRTGGHVVLSLKPVSVQCTLIHLRIQKEAAAFKPERNIVFLQELEEIRGKKMHLLDERALNLQNTNHFSIPKLLQAEEVC